MFLDEYSYLYNGGAPVNCAFTEGKHYYFIQPYKNGQSFYIDDNLNVRIVKDDCFTVTNQQIRVDIKLPKFPADRNERLAICKRWNISEPTLKDWFDTRPFLIKDAFKGLNSAELDLSNLPALSANVGYYYSEIAVRWGYFNTQSIDRIVKTKRRIMLISDAFNGVGK